MRVDQTFDCVSHLFRIDTGLHELFVADPSCGQFGVLTEDKVGHAQTGIAGLTGMSMSDAERELIRNTLKSVDGNRQQAAKILEIGERTLYRKIKEYGLND